MINNFIKYTIFIFFALLTLINAGLAPKITTYSILAIYILLIFYYLYKKPQIFLHKAFSVFIIMDLATLLYWIMFDLSVAGFAYFAARATTFGMISISIYFYHDYLMKNFPKFIIWVGFFLLLYGVATNQDFLGGRYSGPFGNPNSLGWFSSLLFGLTLLEKKAGNAKTFLLLFFLGLTLTSGSRAAFGGVILAFILNGQFNLKKFISIIVSLGVLLIAQQIASGYGFHTGLDRIIASEHSEEGMLSGRSMEWLYAYETFLEAPLTGHGLNNYAYISEQVLIRHGVFKIDPNFAANPHNSFMAVSIQYGAVFAGFIIAMLLFHIYKAHKHNCPKKSVYFAIVYSFSAASIESYLFGVSAFEGFIFWSVLPLCLMAVYKRQDAETETVRPKEPTWA